MLDFLNLGRLRARWARLGRAIPVLCTLLALGGCLHRDDDETPPRMPSAQSANQQKGVSPQDSHLAQVLPPAQAPAAIVVNAELRSTHYRDLARQAFEPFSGPGRDVVTLTALPGLSPGDTVEFADRVISITAIRPAGQYSYEAATPFDVFRSLSVSSYVGARQQPQQLRQVRADVVTSLGKWLSFTQSAIGTAQKFYGIASEFLGCTTFSEVSVAARPSLHESPSASYAGYQFLGDRCEIYKDDTGSVRISPSIAVGAEGDFTLDGDAKTLSFKTDGAFSMAAALELSAKGSAKDRHRIVSLRPDFLNPDSTTEYPEAVKILRKLLSIDIYFDVVVYRQILASTAMASVSTAGDFAFGAKVKYDPATKTATREVYLLKNGKIVDADPAKSVASIGIQQFDGKLGAGLEVGYAIQFSQSSLGATEQVFGDWAAGLSGDVSLTARARAGAGAFLDANVGPEVSSADCRFTLRGTLSFDNFYQAAYRLGSLFDAFTWSDGPQFLFTSNEGLFDIHDFVGAPTSAIDASKFCGPTSTLVAKTELPPRVVLRNNRTGKSYDVGSAGDIAQFSRLLSRDWRDYTFEVDTAGLSRYPSITFDWSVDRADAFLVGARDTSSAFVRPLCNAACPGSFRLNVKVAYGTKTVTLPVNVPFDSFGTPRGRFNVTGFGAHLDASESTDDSGPIKKFIWYSPSGIVLESDQPSVILDLTSPFFADLAATGRSPSIAVVDAWDQHSQSGTVLDPALAVPQPSMSTTFAVKPGFGGWLTDPAIASGLRCRFGPGPGECSYPIGYVFANGPGYVDAATVVVDLAGIRSRYRDWPVQWTLTLRSSTGGSLACDVTSLMTRDNLGYVPPARPTRPGVDPSLIQVVTVYGVKVPTGDRYELSLSSSAAPASRWTSAIDVPSSGSLTWPDPSLIVSAYSGSGGVVSTPEMSCAGIGPGYVMVSN